MGLAVSTKKVAPTVREPGDLFEREVKFKIDELNRCPILDGKLVTVTFVATTTKLVAHTLGRPYRGWWVVDQTVATVLIRDTAVNVRQSEFIPLQADVDSTLTLWIF